MLVDGSFADKPARMVDPGGSIELVGPPPRYVSRAGEKLAAAIEHFGVDPNGLDCLDAGSSTGGFTDCLLQHGARSVLAVDVGTNQLHERLRFDGRVQVREQTDIRSITRSQLSHPISLVVGDLSFISLNLVLPNLAAVGSDSADFVLLVKPQFEAGRQEASRGRGVITDPAIWRRVLHEVAESAANLAIPIRGVIPSPVTGSAGNVEFVTWLGPEGSSMRGGDEAIEAAVERAAGHER